MRSSRTVRNLALGATAVGVLLAAGAGPAAAHVTVNAPDAVVLTVTGVLVPEPPGRDRHRPRRRPLGHRVVGPPGGPSRSGSIPPSTVERRRSSTFTADRCPGRSP